MRQRQKHLFILSSEAESCTIQVKVSVCLKDNEIQRERERDDEHLKHKTFSDVRGDKDVPVHFRC